MKDCKVRVETKPRLVMGGWGMSFGSPRWKETAVLVDEAVLTDPVGDFQGCFLGAELKDSKGTVWYFGKRDKDFYLEVKRALEEARKPGADLQVSDRSDAGPLDFPNIEIDLGRTVNLRVEKP